MIQLLAGDCLESMKALPDNSVDSVVTDPPYGLSFMGKKWDYDVPSEAIWRECLRVLKPGGYLLAFAGTRTQHRMAVRIEDAGFEIRDMIAWVYGSGFPKSLDVAKALDKQRTEDVEPVRVVCRAVRAAMDAKGLKSRDMTHHFGDCHPRLIDHWAARDTDSQPVLPTWEQWETLRDVLGIGGEHDAEVWRLNGRKGKPGDAWQNADVIGTRKSGDPRAWYQQAERGEGIVEVREPSDAPRQWQGFGTALKPAWENVGIYQKPLTVAGYCAIMISNLTERIESCRQNASNAEKSSRHSQADSLEAKTNTVPENAATRTVEVRKSATETGQEGDTSSKADISELALERENIALNTLLSWKSTLVDAYVAARTSTISTVLETIIDWKILSFCLSKITPNIITKAKYHPSGLSADAHRAVVYLHASLASLQSTLTLFALAPVMSPEANDCLDVGAKPALEPVTVARKPLIGTVAENVLAYGTGAINIDASRIPTDPAVDDPRLGGAGTWSSDKMAKNVYEGGYAGERVGSSALGRWPANLIHDGSEEVVALFPNSNGAGGSIPNVKVTGYGDGIGTGKSEYLGGERTKVDSGSGSAARFFYCAKASKKDRNEGLEAFDAVMDNFAAGTGLSKNGDGSPRNMNADAKNPHPTVKPTELMRYLCRLVTPPGGTILDPFTGSGSTGKAAVLEGFSFIGCELSDEYLAIARARIDAAANPQQPELEIAAA